jgi:CHAT domain-containing protein
LHVLPFAALHDGRNYVVAQRTIQYLPSLNALRFIPGASEAAGTSRISFSWARSGQAPLTFAPREAEALALTFPDTMVLKGPTATRAQFIAEAPKAKFIHLATHATYQENQPLLSALELADKPLPVAEILGLPLKADLVILSACETGLGSLDGADGVTSLHRAFLSAGARRVVSSLFRVTDLGTALLMKHFFRHLTQLPPAAALRHAQNDLRQRFPHPAFWSGFRLDGRLD